MFGPERTDRAMPTLVSRLSTRGCCGSRRAVEVLGAARPDQSFGLAMLRALESSNYLSGLIAP